MPQWNQIVSSLQRLGIPVNEDFKVSPVRGGDNSSAWRLRSAGKSWFLKTGAAQSLDAFEAEAEGLRELRGACAVRVPESFASCAAGDDACLLLEWIEFGQKHGNTDKMLGELLAAQHRCTSEHFGWHRDNTIGATPQRNDRSDDWVDFYRRERLGYQLTLAARNGYGGSLQEKGEILLGRLDAFFVRYRPQPSLLHGDLWGGNYAAADGQPVIFDPAVYFGDREADLAMTRLFGGFSREFYEAYAASWPPENGHEHRLQLYQLYHVLNHLNLFGDAYLGRAVSMIDNLIRDAQAGGASSVSSTT